MNKPRIILAAICLLAAVGGAFASKARFTKYWYTNGSGVYTSIEAAQCVGSGNNCSTTLNDIPYRLYLPAATPGQYVAQVKS